MISDGLGLVFRAQFGGGTWGVIAVSHVIFGVSIFQMTKCASLKVLLRRLWGFTLVRSLSDAATACTRGQEVKMFYLHSQVIHLCELGDSTAHLHSFQAVIRIITILIVRQPGDC